VSQGETAMSSDETEAITTVALIAALADGRRQAEEEAELQRIADAVGGGDYGALARRVLAGQVRLADVVARLESNESRLTAYEMAVVVCHADGVASEAEKAFLGQLRAALGLDQGKATDLETAAHTLASAPPAGPTPEPPAPAPRGGPRPSQAGMPAVTPDAAIDDLILRNAMLAAALELLPQGLATLAILPVQARMVYRIGVDYGHRLDRAQIADLAAAMGIGAAGQVFEGTARRLLGGLAGRLMGRAAGGVARAATGAAVTFATTYALGQAARQYYAQGRSLTRADLRQLFGRLRDEAGELYPRVEATIREQAQSLKLGEVLDRLRSPGG
jgi:uncharacterized protein (DUF697 family)/tellurite resistance protein